MTEQSRREAAVEHYTTNFQEEDGAREEAENEKKEDAEVAIAADARWDCGSMLYDASELVAFTKLLPVIDHADQNTSNSADQTATSSCKKNNIRFRPPSDSTLSSPFTILKKYSSSSSLQQGPPARMIRDRSLLENCINPHDRDHQKAQGFSASIRPAHDQQPKHDTAWSFAKWIRLMKRTLRTGHNLSKQQRCPHEEAIEKIVKHSAPRSDYCKYHTVHHHHYHHHHHHLHHLLYNSSDDNLLLNYQDCDQLDDQGPLVSHNHKDHHDQLVAHKVVKGCSHPCKIRHAESTRLSFDTISKLSINQNWM